MLFLAVKSLDKITLALYPCNVCQGMTCSLGSEQSEPVRVGIIQTGYYKVNRWE